MYQHYPLKPALFLALSLCLAVAGCRHKHVAYTGFYYWRTDYNPNQTEDTFFKNTGASKLYVRFFDLRKSYYEEDAFPLQPDGIIKFTKPIAANVEVVPVVFIPNETLLKLDTAAIPELAAKMRRKMERMCTKQGIKAPKEYQLDCDWTNTTRSAFFKLVKEFKSQVLPAQLSVTVRLYQYKYLDKSGVPPADRALLMFYNMGNLKDTVEENYILNLKEATKYLSGTGRYPLPLDIGLPTYSQGVKFVRNRYDGLIQADDVEEAIKRHWLKHTIDNWYVTTGDSTATWEYMGPDVRVRYEKVIPGDLKEAAELLGKAVHNDTCNIVFYHLDEKQLKLFNPYDLQKVVADF